jgi:hypothetical protein
MTNTSNMKKGRLRLLLIAAAALGSSSATLSGAVSALALQNPPASVGGASHA